MSLCWLRLCRIWKMTMRSYCAILFCSNPPAISRFNMKGNSPGHELTNPNCSPPELPCHFVSSFFFFCIWLAFHLVVQSTKDRVDSLHQDIKVSTFKMYSSHLSLQGFIPGAFAIFSFLPKFHFPFLFSFPSHIPSTFSFNVSFLETALCRNISVIHFLICFVGH